MATTRRTANEEILEQTIAHAVQVERYKAGTVRRVVELLNATEEKLEEQLAVRVERIVAAGGFDAGPETTERLQELLEVVGGVRAEAYAAAAGFLREELSVFAAYEAQWQAAVLQETLIVELGVVAPSAEVLRAAVFERPFGGAVFEHWVDALQPADLERISRAVQVGVVEGQTTQQIVRNIVGTRGASYTDGVVEMSRRSAETLVRTSLNHTSTQAREEVYRANEDIIEEVRWVATLDGRTTMGCMALDGKTFPPREGPRPPRHPGCRSSTVPVINGVKLVGDRPAITDARTRRQREIDFRAEAKAKAGAAWSDMSEKERRGAIARVREKWARENIGQVPKGLSYEDWLRRQSASFQDEVLGPTRGQLFRNGGLSVERFTDASGKTLTLEALREAEAEAFKKAKL
ncbi:minor capsid protein [Myxococcus sp. MxC21-1]|uniref:minor capsid protein n=1 Tax=Myxococcus sp. MxC21-1 TaxID=3041439 RepID=UPI0029316028|nr:minor capsid protein [Myxococcus sp. MxC21-1]WNZ59915.1 minor capsid protein [Myxococcus sp. MxC21-1]